jgi:spore coat polysaccharide biosynthesis predicted glycosyltransferase SpsG
LILIFTEALATTGLGHLGRCTALAEKLIEAEKEEIQIIVHTDKSFPEWKFPCEVQHYNWKDEDLLTQYLKKSINKDKTKNNYTFYVDSYLAPLKIYQFLKNNCDELVCIDDDDRSEYPAGSTILNPGYPGLYIKYDKTKYKVITGKDQVLLRKPFREKFAIPQRNKPPQKVLVTLGGADPNLFSEKLLKILVEHFPNIEKHLVIGNGFTNEEMLHQIKDDKTVFHKNLSAIEMRDLMLSVDYAVSAGGQTTYELDACGVPFVVIQTAENQRGNIRGFVELQGVREIKELEEIITLLA